MTIGKWNTKYGTYFIQVNFVLQQKFQTDQIFHAGFIIYFYYGIKNSTLEQEETAEDQTIIAATTTTPQVQVTHQQVTEVSEKPKAQVQAVKKPVNEPTQPTRPTTLDPPKASNKTDLFVSPSAFPKWDD